MKMSTQAELIELQIRIAQEIMKMLPVATGLMTIVGISLLGWWVTLAWSLVRGFFS